MKTQILALSLALVAIPFSACDCSPPDVPDVPVEAGDGVMVIDGEEEQYAVDFDQSELIIVLENFSGNFGCGLFHSHAIESKGFATSFNVDLADPGGSTFTAVVPAIGLAPDSDELRERFVPDEVLLGDNDRNAIKVSTLENLNAEEFPTLRFAARDLTSTEGAGRATVDVEIAGATSEITLEYEITEQDGTFTLEGEGFLDGTPHGIPNGFASDCVNNVMDLHLKLVLVPGGSNAGDFDAGIVPYEETFFPYEGDCAPDVAFEEVRQILGPRCMGCHMDPERLGASVPLVEYDDLRVDAARTVGEPLFRTMALYIQLPEDESLHMPPIDVSPLTTDELQTLVDWAAADAPDVRCTPEPIDPFVHEEPAACGTIVFDDIKTSFLDVYCAGCHEPGQTIIPPLDIYEGGLVESDHPFYRPLNQWEASAIRLGDGSMPPYFGPEFADDPEAAPFMEWVAQGYPNVRCDIPDAGPDAGADAGDAG